MQSCQVQSFETAAMGVQDVFNSHAISQSDIACHHSSCNLDEGSSTVDVLPFLYPQKIAATRIPPTAEEIVEMTRATYQSNGSSHSLVHLNNDVEQMEKKLHALMITNKCTKKLIYSHCKKNVPKKLLQRCRYVNEGIYSRINHFYQLRSHFYKCSLNTYSKLDAFKYQLHMITRNSKRSLKTIKYLMKEAIKFKLNVPLENMKCCNSKIVCYSKEMLLRCGSRPRNRKVHRSTCHATNNMKTTLIQDDTHFVERRAFLQNSPKNAIEKKLHALMTTNKCTERLIFSHRTKNISKRFLQRCRCVNEGIYSRINRLYQCSLNTHSKLDCKYQLYMIIKNSKRSLKTIKDLMKEAIKFKLIKLNVPLENMKYCNSKIVCYGKEMLLHCGSIPRNRKVHRSTCHATKII